MAGSERVEPLWQFKSLIWGISSMFPLTNHFDLPGSESVFGVSQDLPMYARASQDLPMCARASQDLPMCARASLSQGGCHRRGLWVASIS